MRQSWDLRPAGKVGGAWLVFTSVSALCLGLAWGQIGTVQAQEEPQKDEPPAAAKDEAAEPAAKAPAPSRSAAAEEGTKPPARENMLQWAIRASGPIGLFLLCLSVYFTALVIRLFMEYRVSEAVPTPPGREARGRDPRQEVPGSVRRLQGERLVPGPAGPHGIANLPNGRPEAKEAMLAMSDEIVTGLEMKISYLATIGTLGPMIGLVGTVWGMIMSFQDHRHRGRRAAPAREGRRGNLHGALHHARGHHPVGAGDLLLRLLPQPDLPDDDGSQQGRRSDHQLAGRGGQDLETGLSQLPPEATIHGRHR